MIPCPQWCLSPPPSNPHRNLTLPSPTFQPAYRQQDQSHQGWNHCSFTSWINRTPKCRNWWNQGAVELASHGSHWSLNSCSSPGSTSLACDHREHPCQCPSKSSCQGLLHCYWNTFCSRTPQVRLGKEANSGCSGSTEPTCIKLGHSRVCSHTHHIGHDCWTRLKGK